MRGNSTHHKIEGGGVAHVTGAPTGQLQCGGSNAWCFGLFEEPITEPNADPEGAIEHLRQAGANAGKGERGLAPRSLHPDRCCYSAFRKLTKSAMSVAERPMLNRLL